MNKITNPSLALVLSLFGASQLAANAGPAEAPEPVPAVEKCCNCPTEATKKFYKTQFYAGMQGGYDHLDAGLSGVWTNSAGNQFPFSHGSDPDGFIGEIFLGGRYVFNNCMVLGLEVDANMTTNKTNRIFNLNNNTRSFRVKYDKVYAVIPGLVGGYIFADAFMVYTRLGLAIAGFKGNVFDLNRTSTNARNGHNFTKIGFAPALGVEYGFTSSMSARGEIGAEFYGSMGATDTLVIPNNNNQTVVSRFHHPKSFNAKLGVVVKI